MCIVTTGLILISAITGAFYHFVKIAIKETHEDEDISMIKENIPIKPPRKSRKNPKLDISKESASIRERYNTCDSTISNDHGYATKLIRIQLEKIPNKTASTCEETLNSSKLLMPKSNVDLVSNDDESQLRVSERHSSMTLLEDINDTAKKSVIRKESNVTSKKLKNEISTFYMDLPKNAGSLKDRSISTSTKINNSDESNEFDNELTTINKVFYFLNEKDINNILNNNVQEIMIKIKENTNWNNYENNKEGNSSMRSDSYYKKNEPIVNTKTSSTKKRRKLLTLFSRYSK